MDEQPAALTPMDVVRYYMGRMAMCVEAEHYQELCRTVAYAIEPMHTAYNFAVQYGISDLPMPEDIFRTGRLPSHPERQS
ncbi:hypothetical protein NKDENANG_02995 [Candidatus Entotheonellaceae bacterium PAL068K]